MFNVLCCLCQHFNGPFSLGCQIVYRCQTVFSLHRISIYKYVCTAVTSMYSWGPEAYKHTQLSWVLVTSVYIQIHTLIPLFMFFLPPYSHISLDHQCTGAFHFFSITELFFLVFSLDLFFAPSVLFTSFFVTQELQNKSKRSHLSTPFCQKCVQYSHRLYLSPLKSLFFFIWLLEAPDPPSSSQ